MPNPHTARRTCRCRRSRAPSLEDSAAADSVPPQPRPAPDPIPALEDKAASDSVPPEPRPGQSPRPHAAEALSRGPPALTFAPADLAVVAFAVDVVALAELAVDLLVGHVARVAHALPADAVPQPRADDGAVVLAAAALQLLAAPALRLALAVLPDVAGVTPAGMRGQSPPERTLLPGACAGGGAEASPADAALHRASAAADAAVPAGVPALALALGEDPHGHRVREAQRPDGEGLLLDALGGCDLHLEGDLSWERRAQVSMGPQAHDPALISSGQHEQGHSLEGEGPPPSATRLVGCCLCWAREGVDRGGRGKGQGHSRWLQGSGREMREKMRAVNSDMLQHAPPPSSPHPPSSGGLDLRGGVFRILLIMHLLKGF